MSFRNQGLLMINSHVDLKDALQHVPDKSGNLFATLFSLGSLEVEIYVPEKVDLQHPHTRDELYFVIEGSGMFVNGEVYHAFGPGDLLFVPAGIVHRFEDFSDDFKVWVVFFGPEGGHISNTV